jgi:tetratricopeptide (TPR) repeat protein
MPKGTRVRCTAIYDNSADNLRNPDPTRTICYGHQTWEEMMAGTMGIVRDATPAELAQAGLESPSPQTATSDPLVGYLDVEAVQPDKRDVYFYQRALFRKLQGDPAGAVADLNAALEHNPKLVDALYERGRIRHDAHRFAVAEDDFNQALAVEPDDVKCLVGRGKARFRLENLTGALADFDRAVALDPWDREALYYRSVIRQLKRDVDGALADLDKLTREVSPRYIAGHWDRAMLLLALGRVDEAMPNLDCCLEQDPDRKPEVDFQLGLAYLRREEPDQAARRFAAVIEQTPRRAEAHVMLGLAYGKQGDAAEEVAHVRQALEIEPNYFAAHFQLARILWTQRDARGALEHLRHCRRIDPSNLDAANLLAWILATHSDPAVRSPAEAIALAEHVCRQSNHQQPGYIDTLAAAYAAAGRYADAIDTATKAIQLGMATRQIALTVNIQERRRLYRDSKPYFESNP